MYSSNTLGRHLQALAKVLLLYVGALLALSLIATLGAFPWDLDRQADESASEAQAVQRFRLEGEAGEVHSAGRDPLISLVLPPGADAAFHRGPAGQQADAPAFYETHTQLRPVLGGRQRRHDLGVVPRVVSVVHDERRRLFELPLGARSGILGPPASSLI